MEEIKFNTYFVKLNRFDYTGTSTIIDGKDSLIARSRGVSIKNRNISYTSSLEDYNCEIKIHSKRKYSFIKNGEVQNFLRPKNRLDFYSLELVLINSSKLTFVSQDLGKNYMIGLEKIHIGIISCEDWCVSDIKIRIIDSKYINEIFCVVIAIGHYFNKPYFIFR